MFRKLGFTIGAAGAAVLSNVLLHSWAQCTSCDLDPTTLKDFLTGGGLLVGLYFAVSWLETAPLKQVALHLAGTAVAVGTVFSIAG